MHTTLTSKGQMTLPSAMRSRMGLAAGDQLLVTMQDANTIVLTRPVTTPSPRLRGFLSKPKKALTVEQMDEGVARYLKEKHAPKRTPRQKP